MLISCKCLNFIATSNNQQNQLLSQNLSQHQQPAATSAIATADVVGENAAVAMQQLSNDCTSTLFLPSSKNNIITKPSVDINPNESFSLTNALRKTFLQKYSRSFIFYSQCVDFFQQAIGPVPDLVINALNQRDLIYSLTVDENETEIFPGTQSSWQLSICSNCNVVLCAKLLNSNPQFLINCGLLTNNEELSQKRSDKSFSDTFGLLIMDHSQLEPASNNHNANNNLTMGALSNSFATSQYLDSKQLRLRQLQYNMQQRLQREIAETDERIQRYTTQQFALLKSFREKSEREYQMLVSLIQCIPEQQANELLERQPPAFDVFNTSGNLSGARRRNTISNRLELNKTATAPSTPTAIQTPINLFTTNRENIIKNSVTATSNANMSAIITTTTTAAMPSTGVTVSSTSVATSTTPTLVGSSSALNRKMSNFDTPPATPESLPMSVGNSPTFRQQQQQITHFTNHQQSFQQQFPTPTIEPADDCLFELDGLDGNNVFSSSNNAVHLQNSSSPLCQLQFQNVPHQTLPHNNIYQRSLRNINTESENQISDLEESDDAEEAEDALGLDSAMSIAAPKRRINSMNTAQAGNFAKSLPIEISNSPLTVGRSYMATLESDEDELENNVDIAASIKALAKSVHGETVFGDLPRPRLRSQI